MSSFNLAQCTHLLSIEVIPLLLNYYQMKLLITVQSTLFV